MKYYHNSRVVVRRRFQYVLLAAACLLAPIALLFGLSEPAAAPTHSVTHSTLFQQNQLAPLPIQFAVPAGPMVTAKPSTAPAITHLDITTTIFWVGETADNSNDYIANSASAWDGAWRQHFGGTDDPAHRTGYRPAAFIPKENPFYVALPYSDLTNNGNRKASGTNCPQYGRVKDQPYSWCKNSWIAISHGNKTVYAQWEDAGPFEDDDMAYVFGKALPKNSEGVLAGLDVSPAVRDYLGLQDVSSCTWMFADAGNVPDGPWKQTVTAGPGTRVN
jgi:hypothetical protein